MTWMLVATFLALCGFTFGQGLQCYSCSASMYGYCITNDRAKVNCADVNQRCGIIKVSSRYSHIFTSFRCLTSGCNQIIPVDATTGVGVNITCCDSDLCNSGPATFQFSLLSCAGILGLWLLNWA